MKKIIQPIRVLRELLHFGRVRQDGFTWVKWCDNLAGSQQSRIPGFVRRKADNHTVAGPMSTYLGSNHAINARIPHTYQFFRQPVSTQDTEAPIREGKKGKKLKVQ